MKKVLNLIKKNIFGIIIGLVLGSVSVYAGTKMYASDVSVNAPAESHLGSNATLQNALDDLYSIADKYDELKTEINALKNNTSKEYLNKIYPIGSIYMSMNNISPATFLGGTWEPLKDRFLIGAGNSYSVNSTGGETTHKLTISEMPSHNHNVKYDNMNMTSTKLYGPGEVYNGFYQTTSISPIVTTTSTGGSQAHNNMPPYRAVYMWKRTK